MSWHFSRALVAAFSGDSFSGGEPYAPLKSTPMPATCCLPGKTTDASNPSPCGMMSRPSTGDRGLDWWMSCLLAGLAKTFHARIQTEQGLTANGLDCGQRSQGFFAKYDRPLRCWKTPQTSLIEGLDVFSESWPRWGSMRNGVCFTRAIPGWITNGRESGLLPTPCAQDWQPICWARAEKMARGENGRPEGAKGGCANLPDSMAAAWLRRMKRDVRPARGTMPRANPSFWETLMGWPEGWTDCERSATDKYQEWRQWHGGF